MAVSPRESRAMKLTSGDRLEDFGDDRSCGADGCSAKLSRYNPSHLCAAHAGWLDSPKPRARRRPAEAS